MTNYQLNRVFQLKFELLPFVFLQALHSHSKVLPAFHLEFLSPLPRVKLNCGYHQEGGRGRMAIFVRLGIGVMLASNSLQRMKSIHHLPLMLWEN